MFRFPMICSDDVDEDFLDEEETEWEDACCEDPYWDEDEDDNEVEWCD
ncbi:hypothetical protein WCX18_00595 [Sulfurimonas sp. HSL1-2]